MAAQTASTVRASALRRSVLSLAKACSIGFRSGEYFGGAAIAELLESFKPDECANYFKNAGYAST